MKNLVLVESLHYISTTPQLTQKLRVLISNFPETEKVQRSLSQLVYVRCSCQLYHT